jgi:hypothetical protein
MYRVCFEKNIGLWWRYGISRHCDEWKNIIIGRIFESEIILIPTSLKISESSSNGSYRNTDEVWWRYGISRSCDECTMVKKEKDKRTNSDIQNITKKRKDRTTLTTEDELRCSGRVDIFCFTCGCRRVTLVYKPRVKNAKRMI